MALLAFFNVGILVAQTYSQDEDQVDFYIPGILANDSMESVNFLICFVKNTNFGSFVDAGVYLQLVDEEACRNINGFDAASELDQATGGSTEDTLTAIDEIDEIKYTPTVLDVERTADGLESKGWVSLEFDLIEDQIDPVTAYVKTSQTEDASATSRFGSFNMLYELKNDADVLDSNGLVVILQGTTIESGFLDVNDSSIRYRAAGFEMPPRALDLDLTNLNNVQGVIQHNVKIELAENNETTSTQYSVRHQIHVNEAQNRYCQKFLDAHIYTQGYDENEDPIWVEGSDVGEAVLQAAAEDPNLINFESDGASVDTLTGAQCWDLRQSESKRIIYQYGTYEPTAYNNSVRKSLPNPSMSLEAKPSVENNEANGLTSRIWVHANDWGVHVDVNKRGLVNDNIVFKNNRDNLDLINYGLRKNYYSVEKIEEKLVRLDSLDKVPFQYYIGGKAREDDPFHDAITTGLGFATLGNCSAATNETACPEFSGTISVDNGVVTFTATHAMDWGASPQELPFEMDTPISFTAAEWAANMDVDGRQLGMWFHDTDSHQGYYVSYEAFQSPDLALVRTELETRISLEDLQDDMTLAGGTNLICIRQCLGFHELNDALNEAIEEMEDLTTPPAADLLVTPYLDIGPYFTSDVYEDNEQQGANLNQWNAELNEKRYNKGRHNMIGGVHVNGVGKYIIENGKLKENMTALTNGLPNSATTNQTDFIEYDANTNNKSFIDARDRDTLHKFTYQNKNNTYLEGVYTRNFGYAFHMEVVIDSNTNIDNLYCDDDGNNAYSYNQFLRVFDNEQGGIIPAHFSGVESYYCEHKFHDLTTKYRIKLKQRPVYSLVNQVGDVPIPISAPENVFLTVNDNVDYNFDGAPNLNGRTFKLKFEGFGELHNFPGKVVDICQNVVIGRYTDSWDPCKRFVHEFTIQDGTILQDKDGNPYLKVRALRGDEYLKKTNFEYAGYTKNTPDTDLPQDDVFVDVSTLIGSEPAIEFPAPGSEEASVIHGVTIIDPNT